MQCKFKTARPSARTTDLSASGRPEDSGPSARCSSRGHPASLRVGRSEESRYSQRCQGVQISDGLGGQGFKLAISRPRGAGTDLQGTCSTSGRASREQCIWRVVQATLGGAVGKGAKGVSKFALVASAVSASSWRFRDAGRVHEPSIFSHPLKSSVTRAVHLASG
jgi:hypothetical protein